MEKASNKFALWLTIGRILSMLVFFAMPLVMTRVLSQSDYGVFSQYFTLYISLNVIFALGFHSNIFYFYPTASKTEKDEYVSNTLFLLLLMAVIAILLLSSSFVSQNLFGDSRLSEYSLLVVISIALAIPVNIVSPLLTVREDKWGAIMFPPVTAVFQVGTVIVAALIKNDLNVVFKSLIVYQLLVLLWVLLYSFRYHKIRFNFHSIKPQVLYSLPFGFSVAIQMFSHYYDKIVCIRFVDSIQYAIYGAAFISIPGINQIYESLCQVNIVNMTKSYQDGDLQGVRELYKDFVIKTLSFSTPIILAVSLFAEEIIGLLYPSAYLPSAHFFRIYSLTFLTYMLGAGTVLRASGKTEYSLLSYALTALVTLPLTYYLIKYHGIEGAIIGAVCSIILPRFVQMFFEAKQTKSPLSQYLAWGTLGYILLVGCVFLLPLLLVKLFFSPRLIVCIILSCIYVFVSYFFYIRRDCFLLTKKHVVAIVRKYTRLNTKE